MASRPNIIFIMADDLGWADLSCYGREDYETPAIDALAAQGIRFTHAYANSAVCTATRVALMTGQYQYRLPIGLEEPLQGRDIGLPPDKPTLPSLLRDAGYRTALVGKWHLGDLPEYCPLKSGFDIFWGIRGGGVDYFTHEINGVNDLWDGETNIDRVGYLTDLLGDRTVEVIEEFAKGDAPFFLNLNFTAPHWPWEGPEDHAESDRLRAKHDDPMPIQHWDGGNLATYAAMVRNMDDNVSKLTDALDRLGLTEDTIIVFTSDNGGERFSKPWPFVGKKTELLEGGLRIPCIVRWPDVAAPGSESDAQVMTMDWLPTFLAAAKVELGPDHLTDGTDMRSAIAGEPLPERTLFWRFANHDQKAARRGKWKYLQMGGNAFLFDIESDPMERANLKDRQPDIFRSIRNDWRSWNEKMLPPDPEAGRHGFTGSDLAEYYGVDS